MNDEQQVNFLRIAKELRRASDEARRAAKQHPEDSERLRCKARMLESAAARIREDARARERNVVLRDFAID
jgi:hypothetical protein